MLEVTLHPHTPLTGRFMPAVVSSTGQPIADTGAAAKRAFAYCAGLRACGGLSAQPPGRLSLTFCSHLPVRAVPDGSRDTASARQQVAWPGRSWSGTDYPQTSTASVRLAMPLAGDVASGRAGGARVKFGHHIVAKGGTAA